MKQGVVLFTLTILISGCVTKTFTNPSNMNQIKNPASEHCILNGGELEIRSDTNGNQYGVCIFENGAECDEWAYFRGECFSKQ